MGVLKSLPGAGSGTSSAPALVRHILVAPGAGLPIQPLARAELVAGRGILGDRYYLGWGHWSDPKWPDQQVTLFEEEVATTLGLPPAAFRRNLVTSGLRLETLLGARFRLDDVGPLLEGVRPCDPCAYIERFTRPGVLAGLSQGCAGGLRARIIEGGFVSAGVRILPASPLEPLARRGP